MPPLNPPHARFESLENPFSPPKARNPDDAKHVGEWLGPKGEEAMRKLLEKNRQPPPEPQEDWSGSEELDLSPEEKEKMKEDKVFGEILMRESQALRTFFGREIPVPPLPAEITIKKIKNWEAIQFRPRYLPAMDMSKEKELKHWKKQPKFNYVAESELPADFWQLRAGWYLIDERKKPSFDNGDQMYRPDIFGPVLEDLRKRNIIQDFKHPRSQFNLSPEELEKPEVIAAFTKALGLEGIPNIEVRLEHCIERNVIGNMHQPDYGNTNTSEWWADKYNAGQRRLSGGGSDGGGLSDVFWRYPTLRYGDVGFRVLVRFSS